MKILFRQIGRRIGAILGSDDKKVKFLGFGKYEGDFIPLEAVGFLAENLRKNQMTNPKLLLDNGKIVYGCECWWGSEEEVKIQLENYKKDNLEIIDVDIDEIRKQYRSK